MIFGNLELKQAEGLEDLLDYKNSSNEDTKWRQSSCFQQNDGQGCDESGSMVGKYVVVALHHLSRGE